MKKKNDIFINDSKQLKTWQIVIIAIILFVIVPIILYLVVCTPNPWGWGIVKPEDTGAWLGLYGAVLGGSLTCVGVVVTIKNQNQETRKLKILDYKPLLAIYGNPDINEREVFQRFYEGILFYTKNEYTIKHEVKFKIGLINNNPNPCNIDRIWINSTSHKINIVELEKNQPNNVYLNNQQPLILNFTLKIPNEIAKEDREKIIQGEGNLMFELVINYSNIYDSSITFKSILKLETTLIHMHKDNLDLFKTINTKIEMEDYFNNHNAE